MERDYKITVHGYGDVVYRARTPGAARYLAFLAFREAYSSARFHWFLTNSRVRLLTPL